MVQFLAYLCSMATIIYFGGFTGNIVFGTYIIGVMASEYFLYMRNKHKNYKWWLFAVGLFVLGFAIWLLDASHTYCVSFGLLNGRSVFHYLNAISIYFLYKFYETNNA